LSSEKVEKGSSMVGGGQETDWRRAEYFLQRQYLLGLGEKGKGKEIPQKIQVGGGGEIYKGGGSDRVEFLSSSGLVSLWCEAGLTKQIFRATRKTKKKGSKIEIKAVMKQKEICLLWALVGRRQKTLYHLRE